MALPVQRGGDVNDRLIRYAQDTYGQLHKSQGQIFYQSGGTGNDDTDNPGTSPWSPVKTITRANALCTAGAGDIVICLDNSPSTPAADETFPIALNKANMTVFGAFSNTFLSDSGIGCDEQNVATFEIGANFVTIEGMYIGCDQLGTTGGLVEFNSTNSYFGTTIRKCTFDTQYVAAYGVLATYDQPYLLIEDCIFGRHDVAGYTTAGIYIGNLTAGFIRNNVFPCVTALGISIGANCGNATILDNRFSCASDTVGMAITAADGSSGCYFDGNNANFGITAMTNNPFRDLNNDNSNTWGLNYKAGTSTMPIGT